MVFFGVSESKQANILSLQLFFKDKTFRNGY